MRLSKESKIFGCGELNCPNCGEELHVYPRYLYCFRCSKQFVRRLFGGVKEVRNTLRADQRKIYPK